MSEPTTRAGQALLAELSENPLAGARYAHRVVAERLREVEQQAAAPSQYDYDVMTVIARELMAEAERGGADWAAFAQRVMDAMAKLRRPPK
jgi:hypothetical protein